MPPKHRESTLNKNVDITEGEAVSVVETTATRVQSEPREIQPLVLDKNYPGDDGMYDFRPQAVEADRPEVNPKGLSAVEPADSLMSETIGLEDFKQEQETIVPVGKGNGKPKA